MAKEKVPALVLAGEGPPVDLPGIPTPRGGYVPGVPVPIDELGLSEEEAKSLVKSVSALKLTQVSGSEEAPPEEPKAKGGEKK